MEWKVLCKSTAQIQQAFAPLPPRDENPRTTRNVTRTKPLFHEPAPSNSYRRGRCNVGRGVSFGGRTTSFHGVQKGAEGRRSTVAPCRGGSTAPTHTHLVFVAPRNTRTLSSPPPSSYRHVEREAHTDAPPRLLNRALSLSLSIAGGVLMEAEICDLDELTSGQRRASLHSSASLNRCRLEGFVLTVQSFSCGRPLTSRGQVYKPGTPLRGKGDRGEVDRGSRWGFQDLGGTTDSAPQFEYGQGDLSVGFSSFFSDSFSFPVFRLFLSRRCSL